MAEVCGGRHQRTGAEGYRPAEIPLLYNDLHWSVVSSEFASLPNCLVGVMVQDAVTHVLCQDPDCLDDKATGKLALFKRGFVSLPRVQAPCLKMTLLHRLCNATAQNDLKASWPLMSTHPWQPSFVW